MQKKPLKLVKTLRTKLNIEEVPVTSLVAHPRNVRMHPEANIQAIMKSLTTFGQQKPIVVDAEGQIIAGNGTFESCKRLGWGTVQIVRTTLMGAQAESFAIADNKTTDMSMFDFEQLSAVLKDLEGQGLDLTTTGFQQYELEPLLEAEWSPGESGEMPDSPATTDPLTIKFTPEQWHMVKLAIDKATTEELEFDVSTDAAALASLCYRYHEGTYREGTLQ